MLDQRTTQPAANFDPLATFDSAGVFARGLAETTPVEAQTRLREVLTDVADWRRLDPDRLQALRVLDAQGMRMLEAMLAEYAALGPHVQSQDRRLAKPAFDLCAAFAQAFEHVLKFLRDPKAHKGLLARTPDIVVRLLRYREIEMALTMCQYDTWQRARWKALHDLYRLAREHGIATAKVVVGQRNGGAEVTVTPEEVYLRILLLDIAGSGQLLPGDIALTRRSLARWAEGLALVPLAAHAGGGPVDQAGFCLDIDVMGGLTRTAAAATDTLLWLDCAPLAAAIEAEIVALRQSSDPAAARRALVMARLAPLYAPQPLKVKRRGERSEVALASVQVAFGGLAGIYRMLRDEARHRSGRTASAPEVDEIFIGAVGATANPNRAFVTDGPDDGSTNAFEAMTAAGPAWQLRDSSDSGCRLRGRASELRHLLPGSLMAFREDDEAPWRLAVVRRLRKILGTNVELGVERLAVGPHRIVLVDPRAPRDDARSKPARTIAFYLPESPACPRIPIKTLVVPANEFAPAPHDDHGVSAQPRGTHEGAARAAGRFRLDDVRVRRRRALNAHRARYRTPITPAAASAAIRSPESPSRSRITFAVCSPRSGGGVVGERRRAEAERRARPAALSPRADAAGRTASRAPWPAGRRTPDRAC